MLIKFKSLTGDWADKQRKKFNKSKYFKALTMCEKCYTFYYKKSWHFEKPQEFQSNHDITLPVRFTQCPACLEQDESYYNKESGSYA